MPAPRQQAGRGPVRPPAPCGPAQPPQPQAPPQQPPPPRGPAVAEVPARPPTATVDSSFTVSSWPCGQAHGSDDSLIGRVSSNVSPQARQRYSYRGTGSVYAPAVVPRPAT
jgi:hypothetical protein